MTQPRRKAYKIVNVLKMKLGRYIHFKGAEYEVVDVVIHSETEEEYVLYYRVETPTKKWIRPLLMFQEWVEHNGSMVQRFKYIGNEKN